LARLDKKRTALALYSLLLVLPTFVLGGLHWRQLRAEQKLELAKVPALAEAGTTRLIRGIDARLQALLESENQRKFYEYQDKVYPENLLGPELNFRPSHLTQSDAPPGILGWFAWDFGQQIKNTNSLEYELFHGRGPGWEEWEAQRGTLAGVVEELMVHDAADGFPVRVTRYETLREPYRKELSFVVINLSEEPDFECLRREKPALRAFDDEFVDIYQYDFHVRFYLEPDGTPRILATRLIMIDGDSRLQKLPPCYSNLAKGATLVQGFFVDPQWLFAEVPLEVAAQVLRAPETFHPVGSPSLAASDDLLVEKIYLVEELGFETYDPADASFGELQLTIDTAAWRPRHDKQTRGFLAVAFMLLMTLGMGLHLFLRSVRRELDQAKRTENFVAAVTHELRTPVSAIRLYGEMLRDGWAANEDKRVEYYGRILHEANRLETMVDRVLEKSQVASTESNPRAGDVNQFISELVQRSFAGANDLHVELDPALPLVMMKPEAIRSIVTNLIENARKYAPTRAGSRPEDRIWLRTSLGPKRREAYIEVLDRGPGIPDEDKESVFQAFYRRGDEGTRSSKGTGLGLHLVKVQAQAVGGDVVVLDRPGGGCHFRVRLQLAPEPDPAEEPSAEDLDAPGAASADGLA